MHLQFHRMIQFTCLLKAGDRQREFNFRKLRNTGKEEFTVNVCDERGNRYFFTMEKKDNNWRIIEEAVPSWISQSEKGLNDLIEKELASDEYSR
jgi:hypothetical protein